MAERRAAFGLVALVALAAAATACGRTGAGAPEGSGPDAPLRPPVAASAAGMVVSGSHYATEAGVRMLEAGGNAVDAAVAAAFGLAVAEPTQSGLGGRTQLLLRMADGTVHGIDGTTQVPAVYDPATAPEGEHGHGAVGIPGTVAALTRALAEHGTLSLAAVVAPALVWARDGIALPEGEARRIAGIAPELEPGSEAARVFLGPGGVPLEAGAVLVQPDLARVLDAVAAGGADAFYGGDVARRIAEDMTAHGGFVTAADLAAYRAVDSELGRGRFGGLDAYGSYLPASGVTVIEILQVLDRLGTEPTDERWPAALVEALLAGFEDREAAERMAPDAAVAWLTSDSLAARRAADIASKLRSVAGVPAVGAPTVGVSAVGASSARVSTAGASTTGGPTTGGPVAGGSMAGGPMAGGPAAAHPAAPARGGTRPFLAWDDGSEPAFTTHVSVADTFGNVVALTQSLGPTLGARVMTPGLGFLYASTLGGYLTGGGPGYRPWSSQAPLVFVDGDRAVLVVGGAGARRILSALVSALDRVVRGGEDLEAALAAPRLHPTGPRVDVEEGWGAGEALTALGYEVARRETSYFARLNAVHLLPDGTFRGVGEPRWRESAAGGPRR